MGLAESDGDESPSSENRLSSSSLDNGSVLSRLNRQIQQRDQYKGGHAA
jgi:hypothetical protein